MAAENSLRAEPQTFHGSVLLYGFHCIFGTRWVKPTGWREKRRDEDTVGLNAQNNEKLYTAPNPREVVPPF